MNSRDTGPRIGFIGLGIMGSAMARNAFAAGATVTGYDPSPERLAEAAEMGIATLRSAAELTERVDIILSSLPSDAALESTVEAIVSAGRPQGQLLVELSTLSLEAKERQRLRLAAAGVDMLDCPVSGTGAQAATRDIVLFASGKIESYRRVLPLLRSFARDAVFVGGFGNGMKMKLVANLLVAIHNVAAAEAILLGIHSGLAPETLVEILGSGAGGSRMLDVRGPLMVSERFEPPTMKLDIWQKDMRLIAEFARNAGVPTPLFAATSPLYARAVADGRGGEDTAAVYAVLKEMAAKKTHTADAAGDAAA
jgi:3-hydroxyisobutyrate dehydrogenase-like beta-hydroxyacid dehydrogenase